METKNILEPYLSKTKSEVFEPIVEKASSELTQPPDSLEPKKIWEEKIRNELMNLYSGQFIIDKSIRGFDAIAADLKGHLKPQEFERISAEWVSVVESFVKSAEENSKDASSQKFIQVSEETLKLFYQASTRYFNHKDFQKASDAFYVIASIDPMRFNVWQSLGLSEANNQSFESALISFSMASILDSESPYPYIYSTECCIKLHRKEEAKIYLKLAHEAIEQPHFVDKAKLLRSIQPLITTLGTI